ncbi:hypothetical protein C5K24_33775, partial [Shigella boydii]
STETMPVRAWKATRQKPNRFPFAKSPKPARKGGTGSTKSYFTPPPCKALKRSQNARKPLFRPKPT